MVKQVGLPDFFATLSCAGLKWDELVSIIGKLKRWKISVRNNKQYGLF